MFKTHTKVKIDFIFISHIIIYFFKPDISIFHRNLHIYNNNNILVLLEQHSQFYPLYLLLKTINVEEDSQPLIMRNYCQNLKIYIFFKLNNQMLKIFVLFLDHDHGL